MRRHPTRSTAAPAPLIGAALVALVVGGVLGPAAAAFATEPSPSSGAGASSGASGSKIGPATPGVAGCALPKELENVTGMVATQKGIFVVEGGDAEQVSFYLLDAACKAELNIYNLANPIDPQDLGVAADGAIVVADIGDTEQTQPSRQRIAIETALVDGNDAKTFRFQYPGGAKFDAKAMVLDKGDVPIVFAQEGSATSIYKPTKALEAEITENLPQMAKIGTFTPAATNTPNPKGAIGQATVTGAAKSPDGKKVVVRTYSDAYEFTVGADGDVAKALTTQPVVTPLPNETDGQAITYSADGTKFITVSKGVGSTLMTWTPYVPKVVTEQPTTPAEEPPADEGILAKIKNLGFGQMSRIIAAVGVVGLVLAIAGIIGIRRARRRRREEEEYDDYDDDYDEPRPRRGRGRGRRDDDTGYGTQPAYSAGYDDQGAYTDGGGYGANGTGGYAANGYGTGGYDQYGGQQQPQQYDSGAYAQYDQGGYGQQQPQQYGGQAGYGADQYGADQYGADQYGADQYGADQYGQQQYGGQAGYGADQYGGDPYAADQYGQQQQYGGQGQYGGYGYEEDFDPMQDPRRR